VTCGQAHQRRTRRTVLRRPLHRLPRRSACWRANWRGSIGARVSAQTFVEEPGRGSSHHVCVVVGGERRHRRAAPPDPIVVPARPAAMAPRPRTGQPPTPDPRRRPGQRPGDGAGLLRQGQRRRDPGPGASAGWWTRSSIATLRSISGSREGRDELDRQVLAGQLRGRSYAFLYTTCHRTATRCFEPPTRSPGVRQPAEPGKNGSRRSPSPKTSTAPEQREARPLTVRRGARHTS
jgi:hypothetical protein